MRLIILTALFFIPLFGFASFPVKTITPSDTIIESKKETMEEYKIRLKKQLYITNYNRDTKKTYVSNNNETKEYRSNNWIKGLIAFGIVIVVLSILAVILLFRWSEQGGHL